MLPELRPYQLDAVELARERIRSGKRRVLICSPTGSGKTVIASHIADESCKKGKRANFVVDRISLIGQTSDMFDRYGIDHGIVQADNPRWDPHASVQVCSIQTIARRKWPDSHLDIIDECHTVTEAVKKRLAEHNVLTLGLTATPFTKGLAKFYDAIVNVTTTHQLIKDGFLAPYRIFSCAEPNMEGVKVVAGEWERGETEKRALEVVGDVVHEYLKHGGGRKFICSAVDTAHVSELQRQFLQAGINAATYTYKDRDEDRAETLVEFRKANSAIRGLITVTAASKGFDCPDIGCVIMARPLRKSLTEHIQFFGRGLRIADGKKDCLVLDHSGNAARFWSETQEFFEFGVNELDDGARKKKAPMKKEAEAVKCPECGHLHKPRPTCPECGHVYPRKAPVAHVAGTLKELVATKDQGLLRKQLWPQIVDFVRKEGGDPLRWQAKCQAIYRSITGEFCRAREETTTTVTCTTEVRNKIIAERIRFRHSQRLQHAVR